MRHLGFGPRMNERVAKQHDDELIERHNGDMDVFLLFVRTAVHVST